MSRIAEQWMPLYPREAQIARAVLGPNREGDWAAIATLEERYGLPMIDALYGGRYWPAVLAYFDRRWGLRKDHVAAVPDGRDNFDEQPRRPRARNEGRKATERQEGSILGR